MAKEKKEITIDKIARVMELGFKKSDRRFEDLSEQVSALAETISFGFDSSEKRFQKIENNLVEVREILEAHTTILKRLDEERIFTLNYVKRLENEIEKIKVHLNIV